MSWGVQAIGYAPAVRRLIAESFARADKVGPAEETIRQAAAKIVDDTLATWDPDCVVRVDARGSLCWGNWDTSAEQTQKLYITVETVHQFVDRAGVKHG